MNKTTRQLKITLVKSTIGVLPTHKLCVKGIGLKRIGHSVTRESTLPLMGMVNKVSYLLKVEEI